MESLGVCQLQALTEQPLFTQKEAICIFAFYNIETLCLDWYLVIEAEATYLKYNLQKVPFCKVPSAKYLTDDSAIFG